MTRRYLTAISPSDREAPDRDVVLVVRDAVAGTAMWTRQFPKDPPLRAHVDPVGQRVILEWSVAAPSARQAIKAEPRLRARVEKDGLKGGDVYVEVCRITDGAIVGRMVLGTGKDVWKIRTITSSGDAVVVTDRHNQVIVYSLSTSERRASVFGRYGLASEAAGLLCVQNELDTVELFDLATMERRDAVRTSGVVRLAQFSADGSRLLVLTSDQVARLLDTSLVGRPRTSQP